MGDDRPSEGRGQTGVSAGVIGQGTPSAGCHFPNGVLKCDSLCVRACVCARVCIAAHTRMSDLRVFGGRQTESFFLNFPIFVYLCVIQSLVSDSVSLA